MRLSDSVACLKDVGAARVRKLAALGIRTIGELICYYPRSYEDRSVITPIAELSPGQNATIHARVRDARLSFAGGLKIVKARLYDESGELEAIWFNQPYLKNSFKPNVQIAFTGMVSERFGRLQLSAPEFETARPNNTSSSRIIPIYPLAEGITQKLLRKLIHAALSEPAEELTENLPADIIERRGLCARAYAVRNIHYPESKEAFYLARRRLVFEELLIFALSLKRVKATVKQKSEQVFFELAYDEMLSRLPFSLTNAQKRTLDELCGDYLSGLVSARLVQGDVGSGKTAIAAIAAYIAVKNAYQAVVMAPTEVLARQHFLYFSELFKGIASVAFLAGSTPAAEKRGIYAKAEAGEIDILIGTHALIEDKLRFARLGLAITDEQHRFGVAQRERLGNGTKPHMLVMTATPIPRTLALVLYGDMDISVIDELPPGRQHIDSYLVNSSMRPRVHSFIEKELSAGRQAYIICPSIEDGDMSELNSAEMMYEAAVKRFIGYNCRLLHGKMKAAEKDAVMASFASGECSVLVSTTVIEVGVNVPNATVMMVENAERFGLAQLHQLRGRVGRGAHKSYCIMLSDSKTKKTAERLRVMTETNDGFKIAELDLKLRGAGDIFGLKQSGLAEFRIANIYEDIGVFVEIQEEISRTPLPSELLTQEIDNFLINYAKTSL